MTIEDDALAYIGHSLPGPQQRALVLSLITYGGEDRKLLIGARAHTMRALQQGEVPLVVREGSTPYLTELGVAVARRLNESGEWDSHLTRKEM